LHNIFLSLNHLHDATRPPAPPHLLSHSINSALLRCCCSTPPAHKPNTNPVTNDSPPNNHHLHFRPFPSFTFDYRHPPLPLPSPSLLLLSTSTLAASPFTRPCYQLYLSDALKRILRASGGWRRSTDHLRARQQGSTSLLNIPTLCGFYDCCNLESGVGN
jgi:hypothetical protein